MTGLYREWDSSDRIFTNEIGRFRFVFFPFVTREGERHRIPQIAGIRERERERDSRNLVDRIGRKKERKKEISRIGILEKNIPACIMLAISVRRKRERELKRNERDSSFLVVSGGE